MFLQSCSPSPLRRIHTPPPQPDCSDRHCSSCKRRWWWSLCSRCILTLHTKCTWLPKYLQLCCSTFPQDNSHTLLRQFLRSDLLSNPDSLPPVLTPHYCQKFRHRNLRRWKPPLRRAKRGELRVNFLLEHNHCKKCFASLAHSPAPTDSLHFPKGQFKQVEEYVAPTVVEYLPSPQLVQVSEPLTSVG